jgi:hypothetical protein
LTDQTGLKDAARKAIAKAIGRDDPSADFGKESGRKRHKRNVPNQKNYRRKNIGLREAVSARHKRPGGTQNPGRETGVLYRAFLSEKF